VGLDNLGFIEAQYEVLGWRSEKATRPGLSAMVRTTKTLSFTPFPSASYWATFTRSLRDGPSRRKFDGLMSKRIGGCRTESGRDPSPI